MQTKIEELLVLIDQKVKIDQVISDYVHLERKGNNYIGLCPFHQDTNPSMSVSPSKGIFKCFSCGAGGNAITFLKTYKGINFIDALKELSDKADINWHDYITEYNQKPLDSESELIYKINEEALIFYKYALEELLTSKNPIYEYVEKRKLNNDLLNKFEIGYASKNKDNSLVSFLIKKGYLEEQIIKTGLVKNNDGKLQDYFIDRLMFPIRDVYKHVIGFSGRVISKSKYSKYLNTPETKVFKKSNVMYNLHNAQSQISLKSNGIIVEGFMDVIAFERLGISNVIATMGTAFTNEHLKQLKALTNKLILAFDNDIPGINTTIKVGKNLLKQKFDLLVMEFDGANDIDEYTQTKTKAEVLKSFTHAIKFIDFYKEQFYKTINKNSLDFELIRKFIALLWINDDELATNFYLNDLAKHFSIDQEVLENQLKKIKEHNDNLKNSLSNSASNDKNYPNKDWEETIIRQSSAPQEEYFDSSEDIPKISELNMQFIDEEHRIIKIASLNYEIFSKIKKFNYVFKDLSSKQIFEKFVEYFQINKNLNLEKIFNELSIEDKKILISILETNKLPKKNNELLIQEAKELIEKLESNYNQQQKHHLFKKIQEAKEAGDLEEAIFLTKALKNL